MNNNIIITYSLLTHLKETSITNYSGIVELFFPIVKKGIVEYANEYGNKNVKGKNISEIQNKINELFGLEIPFSVLDFILSQIYKEISNDKIFTYNNDKSFIINSFFFSDIDEEIQLEKENITFLKEDYENFCILNNYNQNFDDLVKFICSQKLEFFLSKKIETNEFNYHIPKYISTKFSDDKIYKIINDIYLGSIISSYFQFKIEAPIAKTELLIDTNFFISLINLNTQEAFLTCKQLFDICTRLGYHFSILFSTIEQIKILLTSRIIDFSSKEVGIIKESDVFGACIRRGLSKSDLEKIKDDVDLLIEEYKIGIIHETMIKDIIEKAKKSPKYSELLEIRKNQKSSALNDAIAYHYVIRKRGDNVLEFADAKCWFLNNTFHDDYYLGKGYQLHERYKISANELLSLLWLANPNQIQFDFQILSKGGLATYIAKYKQHKVPSTKIIKEITVRAKNAVKDGRLSEKDIFNVSIRMSEGQFTEVVVDELNKMADEDFIKSIKDMSDQNNNILSKLDSQNKLLKSLERQNLDNQYQIALGEYERKKEKYIEKQMILKIEKLSNTAWLYIIFIFFIISTWMLNYLKFKLINIDLSFILGLILFTSTLFIRFIEHKTVLQCLKYKFSKQFRKKIDIDFRDELETKFEQTNEKPKIN